MKRSLRELLQESHVGIVKKADVGHRVAQHCYARRSHPERPAGVFLGIDAGRIEHVGMNHSRAENFHPSGVLAARTPGSVTQLALDIHLRGRLGEREEARTEARARLSEATIRELSESCLEVDEADSF